MWANVARAGAWALPMRNGKEFNFISAVLAELMTDERWMTRDECAQLFQGSVNVALVDRALHWLYKIGAANMVGNSHFRLNGEHFADVFRKFRTEIMAKREEKTDQGETYVCATCNNEYSTLDALTKLKTDELGFFCTCGGDLQIKTYEEDESAKNADLIQHVYSLIVEAENSGELAPKPARPTGVTKRRNRDPSKQFSSSVPLKQSRNL